MMEDGRWNGWRVAQVAHLQLLLHLHQLLLNNLLFSLLGVGQGIPRGHLGARNVWKLLAQPFDCNLQFYPIIQILE